MIDREQVRRDLRSGLLTVEEIARRAGCSVRTVYRIAGEAPAGAGPLSRLAAATKTAPKTKAEANKALSAIIKEFKDYYKETEG